MSIRGRNSNQNWSSLGGEREGVVERLKWCHRDQFQRADILSQTQLLMCLRIHQINASRLVTATCCSLSQTLPVLETHWKMFGSEEYPVCVFGAEWKMEVCDSNASLFYLHAWWRRRGLCGHLNFWEYIGIKGNLGTVQNINTKMKLLLKYFFNVGNSRTIHENICTGIKPKFVHNVLPPLSQILVYFCAHVFSPVLVSSPYSFRERDSVLRKVAVVYLVKKFRYFSGTKMYLLQFSSKRRHCTLSWASWI
jgi:hypothetical protein